MKLKKLLPLASIAGVAAVVAPLVTSCTSAKTYTYIFDADRPASKFEPTSGQADAQEVKTLDEAMSIFLKASKKNNEILADNVIYSIIQYYVHTSVEPDRGNAEVVVHKVDTKTNRISMDIKASITLPSEKNVKIDETEIDINMKLTSIPFTMWNRSSSGNEWVFEPTMSILLRAGAKNLVLAYLLSDKEWNISVSMKYIKEYEKDVFLQFNSNSSEYDFEILVATYRTYAWLAFDNLFYMENVTYKPQ